MTQKQRLRSAIDALYRDPASGKDLARAFVVLEEIRQGETDGTVSKALWERRAKLAFAFNMIQEERQTLDETEDL